MEVFVLNKNIASTLYIVDSKEVDSPLFLLVRTFPFEDLSFLDK